MLIIQKNAFNYARAGACSVIEEMNMTGNILFSEINRIVKDKKLGILWHIMQKHFINQMPQRR